MNNEKIYSSRWWANFDLWHWEKLKSAAQVVYADTTTLVMACQTKTDSDSEILKGLRQETTQVKEEDGGSFEVDKKDAPWARMSAENIFL